MLLAPSMVTRGEHGRPRADLNCVEEDAECRSNFPDRLIIDGPLLIAFCTESLVVTVGRDRAVLPAPECLLFLKRLEDGLCPVGSTRPLLRRACRVRTQWSKPSLR